MRIVRRFLRKTRGTPVGSIYEFGPFEVHPGSGELLKHGRRVKLQDQPFRLLVVLLENAGQVVTREQIQSRIWEENTFVDFDASLRVAVRKLREALGDDAENPRSLRPCPNGDTAFSLPSLPPWNRPACRGNGSQSRRPGGRAGPSVARDGIGSRHSSCLSLSLRAPAHSCPSPQAKSLHRKSPSCSPTSLTPPAILYLTGRCARAWPCNWSSRLF